MSRIAQRFAELKAAGRKALIPFVAAGDPQPEFTVPLMHAMVKAGVDAIELGVPFSDPMADGPVIQRASERALKHRVSLHKVLEMVREFRQQDNNTPVILMGYLNPVEAMGYDEFATAAAAAGVDGVLTVDIPPEEADELLAVFRPHGIDPIFLIAPTTSDSRIEHICQLASGFVYYVSVRGVTGSDALNTAEVHAQVERIRRYTSLPVGVGFGISDAVSARAVGQAADAVIVGSALVRRFEELQDDPVKLLAVLSDFIAELRAALDEA
ncbi:MAG: tryptophan synthase subunit alpha [Thiohalomonadaceae bacterium]